MRMADIRIHGLPAGGALTSTTVFAAEEGDGLAPTKKYTAQQLKAYAIPEFNPGAVPFGGPSGTLTEAPTDLKYHENVLHIENHLEVTGVIGAGYTISVPGPYNGMFFNSRKSALRAGGVIGDQWNDSKVGLYSTAFGHKNQAAATNSASLSGLSNLILASAVNSAIVGGENNFVSGTHSGVGWGEGNGISGGIRNAIISGTSNVIAMNTTSCAIVTGANNGIEAGAINSTIISGEENTNHAENTSINAGENNKALIGTFRGFIGSGYGNKLNTLVPSSNKINPNVFFDPSLREKYKRMF